MSMRWNGPEVLARVRLGAQRGIVAATEEVRNEVLRLILDTPKTGRIYRRRRVEHQASAPGESPASDTRTLVGRIRTDYARLAQLEGVVRASTAYAAFLEYGTSRMAARPFMRPALAGRRRAIEAQVAAGVRAALRGIGL